MRDIWERNSQEVKIFLTLFLIFAVFIHWGGVNSYSRYDLTKAIVEDGSTRIAPYSDNTIDKIILSGADFRDYMKEAQKSKFNRILEVNNSSGSPSISIENRTELVDLTREVIPKAFEENEDIYSDKAPMSSILAVPGYVFVDSLGLEDDSIWVDTGEKEKPAYTSLKHGLTQFLITLTVSALFGSLLLVLIYRDIRREMDAEKAALVTVLALGLASPLFYYSSTFFGVITGAFFGYLSFYLIKSYLEDNDTRYLLVSGISGGLAFATEYYTAIIPVVLSFYLWYQSRDRKPVLYYIGAVLLGTAPLIVYNYVSTGNPFNLLLFQGSTGVACQPYAACFLRDVPYLILDPSRMLNVAGRLLFFPTRGLFFYSPILLASLPGFVYLYRKGKSNLVYPGIFLLFLLFNSSWKSWMAGISFGPRYLLPAVPFLAVPLAYGIQKMFERGFPWRALVAALLILSFGITLTGFAGVGGKQVSPAKYEERFNSFQPIKPDLWPERVQGFMQTGPRSPLLEILLGQRKDHSLSYGAPQVQLLELAILPGSFLLLNTAFLPVVLLLLALILVFSQSRMRAGLATFAVLILLLSLTTATAYLESPAFPQDGMEGGLLDGEEGELRVMWERGEMVYLVAGNTVAFNFSHVNVSVNGDTEGTYRIDGKKKLYLMGQPLREGANTITLRNLEGCRSPAAYDINQDSRCLSLWVDNISVMDSESISSPLFIKDWYGREDDGRWMRERAEILFTESGLLNMSFLPYHGLSSKNITVSVNGEEWRTIKAESGWNNLLVPLPREANQVALSSGGGCKVPAVREEDSDDNRCLSFRFKDPSIVDTLEKRRFLGGWHAWEGDERWMKEKAYVAFPGGNITRIDLQMLPYSEGDEMRLTPHFNGKKLETIVGSGRFNRSFNVRGVSNEDVNLLALKSVDGCRIPAIVEQDSNDPRCLSFRLKSLDIERGEGWSDD